MQFNELVKEVKNVNFDTLRMDSDDYFEAVILNSKLANLNTILERFFGPPVWPSREALPPGIENVLSDFGGIMPDQTLYFWNQASDTIFIMLWPWRDGAHTTVKIAKK